MSKAMFRVVWDAEHVCDGFDCNSFCEAVDSVYNIYAGWILDGSAIRNSVKDFNPEDWNYMIDSCSAEVQKLNTETNEYESFWSPSDDSLEKIGWKYME